MTHETQSEAPQLYEPTTVYDVRLRKAVMVGRARIKPLGVHQMTGEALNAIIASEGADAIDSAKPR
jgi:hypothetical protein